MFIRVSVFRVAGGLLLLALLSGVGLVAAQSPEEDGRINAVAHLGGAAIYCVDAQMNPADNYSEGGLRVLSINGQELLFVPGARVVEVGENPAQNTLLGEANGLALYRLAGGWFQLNGYNEHGQLFEFTFPSCEPIGPAVDDPEPVEEESEPFECPPGYILIPTGPNTFDCIFIFIPPFTCPPFCINNPFPF